MGKIYRAGAIVYPSRANLSCYFLDDANTMPLSEQVVSSVVSQKNIHDFFAASRKAYRKAAKPGRAKFGCKSRKFFRSRTVFGKQSLETTE
jgi:hypothetical protein